MEKEGPLLLGLGADNEAAPGAVKEIEAPDERNDVRNCWRGTL